MVISENSKRKFETKFQKTDSCWVWTDHVTKNGYGKIRFDYKDYYAHRLSYFLYKGPILKNLQIDHLCRNRRCVNPKHLEMVTQKINLMRGNGQCAKNAKKTHCPQNHEYKPENTYVDKKGSRHCRMCFNR